MNRTLLVCTLSIVATFCHHTGFAQDSVLAELYGQGVHAFYANQYQNAYDSLSTVIEEGSQDPRAYYFRGLAAMRLGMSSEEDFAKGGELEAKGSDRVYPVSQSLQRIQGNDRLTLENHRRQARLAARTEMMKAKEARYEELQRAEEQVLRDPAREPAMEADEAVGEAPAEDTTDPFANDAEPMPEPAPELPADDPADTPMPAETPAEPVTPEPAPAPAADDPFGGDTPDPFGSTPAEMPEAADPFGVPETPPAEAPPAETPPAGTPAPADDPFADDPFGG